MIWVSIAKHMPKDTPHGDAITGILTWVLKFLNFKTRGGLLDLCKGLSNTSRCFWRVERLSTCSLLDAAGRLEELGIMHEEYSLRDILPISVKLNKSSLSEDTFFHMYRSEALSQHFGNNLEFTQKSSSMEIMKTTAQPLTNIFVSWKNYMETYFA